MLKRHLVSASSLGFQNVNVFLTEDRDPVIQSCQWISQTKSSVMRPTCCTGRSKTPHRRMQL